MELTRAPTSHGGSHRGHTDAYATAAILALVGVAFLPALVGNFLLHDQWRAFSYGLTVEGAEKWSGCIEWRLNFFLATGRPLVWIPECIEHALVRNIADFKYLRLPGLAVVFATLLIGGFVFRRTVSEYWHGVFLCGPMVLASGYAFMFYQGETASGVMAAVAFSLASAYFAFDLLGGCPSRCRQDRIAAGLGSGVLFLLALFNYAAFAFVAFAVVFLVAMYWRDASLSRRLGAMAGIFVFYGMLSVLYFAVVRFVSGFLPAQELGHYQFALVDAATLFEKTQKLLGAMFRSGRLVNFDGFPDLGMLVIIGAASFVPTAHAAPGMRARMLPKIIFATLFPLIATLGSIPVALSHFEGLETRHVLPVDFMFGFAVCIVLIKAGEACAYWLRTPAITLGVGLLAVAVAAVQQQRIGTSLLYDSAVEVRAIRETVDDMVREGRWDAGKHVHVIRPARWTFSRMSTWFDSKEYAASTLLNLRNIQRIFTMALRERLTRDELRILQIRDCGLDAICGAAPPAPYEIVLTHSHADASNQGWPINWRVLDLSRLAWNDRWN